MKVELSHRGIAVPKGRTMVRIGDINALPQRTPGTTPLPGLMQATDERTNAMNPEERATMLMDVRDALTAQSTD